MKSNPLRWSKGKLILYTIGFTFLAWVFGQIGCGYIYVVPMLLFAGAYACILASKFYRDAEAAAAHNRPLPPPTPTIIQTTHSADSSKLELFGPPTDL